MDSRYLRLLFVLGLICTALAKGEGCECSAAEMAAFGAGGAVATVVGAPLAIAAAGFSSVGIVAGTFASWLMSITAAAGGGGVGTGSLVALLQSIGAAGFSTAGNSVLAGGGGSVLAAACRKIKCG